MERKRKFYFTVLMIFTSVLFASAQPYATVWGHVYNYDTHKPVAGQTMVISVNSLYSDDYHNSKAVTDAKGFYSGKIQLKPGMSDIAITVSTYGFNDELITSTGNSYPNDQNSINLNFPLFGKHARECAAMFKTKATSINKLTFAFMDDSHTFADTILFSYLWNFGDNTTSTKKNPIHTYKKPGLYTVCLHIENSNDSLCSSTICLPVAAGSSTPCQCESYFTYYIDLISKEYVFEGMAINGQADSWIWDFGDGTTASGQKVSHSFNGSHSGLTVCLTATGKSADGTECTSTSCRDINNLTPSACESYFSYQPDSVTNTDYIFKGFALNNQISSWTWDFGDKTTATGQTVTHSFLNLNDTYTVCLTTTGVDANGSTCTHSSFQNIYIYVPIPCESSISYYPDSTGTGYTFEGHGKNNQISSWIWEFGDGTTESGQKVSHTFSDTSKTYEVCLFTSGQYLSGSGYDLVDCSHCRKVSIIKP
jgi:PKD repeat protein